MGKKPKTTTATAADAAPKIVGDVRPGGEFKFVAKPHCAAPSTFAALLPGELRVTRYANSLFTLPDDTPVLAHWHGNWRTDGFATTVGELKKKAKEEFAGHSNPVTYQLG
jgi:hypothetical protein